MRAFEMRGFYATSHTRANTPLFGAGPKALTGLKGVFHWPKADFGMENAPLLVTM